MVSALWFRTPDPGKYIPVTFPDFPVPPLPSNFNAGTQGVWDDWDQLSVANGRPGRMVKRAAYYGEPIEFQIGRLPVDASGTVTFEGLIVTIRGCNTGVTDFDPAQPHWTASLHPLPSAPINAFGGDPKPFDLPFGTAIGTVSLGGTADSWGMNTAAFKAEVLNRGFFVTINLPRWDPARSDGEWQIDGIQVELWADVPSSSLSPVIVSTGFTEGRQWVQHPRSGIAGQVPPQAAYNPGVIAANLADRKLYVVDGSRVPQPAVPVTFYSTTAYYNTGDLVFQDGRLWRAKTQVPPGPWQLIQWEPYETGFSYDAGVY